MTARRRGHTQAVILLVLALAACGRKTDVKPPQLVAPRMVTAVSLTTRTDGIEIGWARPTEYVDGTTMEDLGGFVVERSRNNEAFRELTRVAVTDRGRFQKAKRFQYVDQAVTLETTYHYRIVAFTTDGYYGTPSGVATLTWEPPPPSPAAARAPTARPKGAGGGPADPDSGLPLGDAARR